MAEMKLLIILSLFAFILSQQNCIQGTNCPLNQGVCIADMCECLEGYRTFYNKALPVDQQIFCNYQQINHYYPLILEVFLPGFGHFYVGKYFFGTIKLLLAIGFISSSIYLYHEIKVANFIKTIWLMITNKILGEELKSGPGGINMVEIAQQIFNITFHPFWMFWVFDLYMYFTKSYNDGNGIPLV